MVDRALLRTDSVTTPAGTSTNIIRFEDRFVFQNDPRFVPNVYEGIGMKFDHEWHEITIVFDSDTDIFNPYYRDTLPHPVIPSLVVDHTVITIATQVVATERWTYTPNQIYVIDRREGEVEEGQERQTFEYRFVAYGDRSITYP